MTAHALFIGTNHYVDKNLPHLHCAQRDLPASFTTCSSASWAQLATAYFLSRRASTGYGDLAPKEGERLSTEALANAKRLDPQLSEVHAIEGVMRQFFQHDLVGALAALDRAIALNPANVQAKFWRVDVLQRSGRFRDGLEERLVIARVDPLFNLNNTALAGDLILLGRRAEAQAFIARVSDPASRLYEVARTAAFAFDGAWDEAALVLAQGLMSIRRIGAARARWRSDS